MSSVVVSMCAPVSSLGRLRRFDLNNAFRPLESEGGKPHTVNEEEHSFVPSRRDRQIRSPLTMGSGCGEILLLSKNPRCREATSAPQCQLGSPLSRLALLGPTSRTF
jgi:hypothetical protein